MQILLCPLHTCNHGDDEGGGHTHSHTTHAVIHLNTIPLRKWYASTWRRSFYSRNDSHSSSFIFREIERERFGWLWVWSQSMLVHVQCILHVSDSDTQTIISFALSSNDGMCAVIQSTYSIQTKRIGWTWTWTRTVKCTSAPLTYQREASCKLRFVVDFTVRLSTNSHNWVKNFLCEIAFARPSTWQQCAVHGENTLNESPIHWKHRGHRTEFEADARCETVQPIGWGETFDVCFVYAELKLRTHFSTGKLLN